MKDETFTEALFGTHDALRPLGKCRSRLKNKTKKISKKIGICQLISLRSKKAAGGGTPESLFEHSVSSLKCGYILTRSANISFGITNVFPGDMTLLTNRNSLEKYRVS
jgi:hypothetical protein